MHFKNCKIKSRAPEVNLYLHDYELKHEWQLTDVSWRQVKQEGSVPHGAQSSFSLSAADQNSLVVQIDHHLVFCTQTRKHCFFFMIKRLSKSFLHNILYMKRIATIKCGSVYSMCLSAIENNALTG